MAPSDPLIVSSPRITGLIGEAPTGSTGHGNSEDGDVDLDLQPCLRELTQERLHGRHWTNIGIYVQF